MKESIKKYYNYYKQEIKICLKDLKSIKTFYKQIPNLLTSSRAVAPIVIVPLALSGNLIGATIAASLFAITDFFDGMVARKFNITSKIGRDLDAVCDKVFAVGLIIPLIISNPMFLITILLEGVIGIANFKSKISNNDPKTIYIGKVKTAFLSLSIILGYMNVVSIINNNIINGIFITTSLLQSVTAVKYIKINDEKEKLKNNIELENKKEDIIVDNIEDEKSIINNYEKKYEQTYQEKIRNLEQLKDSLKQVEQKEEVKKYIKK